MKNLRNLLPILINVLLVSSTLAQTVVRNYQPVTFENDPVEARIYTLENGLTVYLSANKEEPRIQTYIAVRAGSKYDPADATGLAHYLEHMLFKGTDRLATKDWDNEKIYLGQIQDLYEIHRGIEDAGERKKIYRQIDSISTIAAGFAIPNEYDKIVSSLGARGTNAYTSFEQTVYTNDIPSNELEKWIKLESERFRKLVLRLFHTELEAVFEEFNIGQDDDGDLVWENFLGMMFPTHPYGTQTVIGKGEHLKNPSMVKIHDYFNKYYVPNNMAICLAGDLDFDKTIQLVDQYFGNYATKPIAPKKAIKEEPITQPRTKEVLGQEASSVMIGFRFDGFNSDEAIMVDLISGLLYNGQAGLIDLNLVQKQKVLDAYTYDYSLHEYTMHNFAGNPLEGQSLEELKDLLLGELDKIKKGEFEDWLIEAVVNDKKLSLINRYASNRGRANAFVESFVKYSNWGDYISRLEKMEKITKAEIIEFANKHYGDNYVAVFKKQSDEKEKFVLEKPHITPVPVNRTDNSPFFNEITTLSSPRIPPVFIDYKNDIQREKLKTGIELNYVPNYSNELFSLYYIFDFGSDHDKILDLAISYLPFLGTNKYSAADLQKEFFKYGLSFDVFNNSSQVYVMLSGLPHNFEKGVALFEHILANVQPDKVALEDLNARILKSREDDKLNKRNILFGGLFNYGLYGAFSPFTNILSEEELNTIDPAELVQKINELNRYPHRVLYYGQETPEIVKEVLNKLHETPDQLLPTPEEAQYKARQYEKNRVFFVEYDMVQTEIIMLSDDGLFNKENIPMANIFNEYFGGGLSSIVFQEIRESKALAYSAFATYSTPSRQDRPHLVYAYIGTQADKLKEAVEAMKELINNMPLGEQQFASAREAVMKKIETNRVTKTSIFFDYLTALKRGLDYDIRQDIYNTASDVTIDDLQQFFDDHVKGKSFSYLIIGKKDRLDMETVKSLGDFKELSIEELFGY